MIIILLLFTLTIVTTFSVRETQDVIIAQIMLLISFAYIGIIVLPLIAMTIRMLHDAGY